MLLMKTRFGSRTMKTAAFATHDMVGALRHLMAPEETRVDFTMPSLLKDVPSFTSTDSGPRGAVTEYAELGGGARGDC